jgi:hypothetical protein
LQLQLQPQNQLQLQYQLQLQPQYQLQSPLKFLGVGNDYLCCQMETLPANAIRDMYSHMFKWLNFKEYLQEKGSLAIYPEGSQDPTHSEE